MDHVIIRTRLEHKRFKTRKLSVRNVIQTKTLIRIAESLATKLNLIVKECDRDRSDIKTLSLRWCEDYDGTGYFQIIATRKKPGG